MSLQSHPSTMHFVLSTKECFTSLGQFFALHLHSGFISCLLLSFHLQFGSGLHLQRTPGMSPITMPNSRSSIHITDILSCFIIINTVSVMFDNYDWRIMLKLLGVSSYRRRIKADRRLKGGDKTMYVLVG